MAKKEYNGDDLAELDNFLQFEFNYDIYQDLTEKGGDYFELFDSLEFLRLLYEQASFIEQNKNKPLFIARSLENLSLSDNQFFYLYRKLLLHFSNAQNLDEQLNVCCREISKLQRNLDVYRTCLQLND